MWSHEKPFLTSLQSNYNIYNNKKKINKSNDIPIKRSCNKPNDIYAFLFIHLSQIFPVVHLSYKFHTRLSGIYGLPNSEENKNVCPLACVSETRVSWAQFPQDPDLWIGIADGSCEIQIKRVHVLNGYILCKGAASHLWFDWQVSLSIVTRAPANPLGSHTRTYIFYKGACICVYV